MSKQLKKYISKDVINNIILEYIKPKNYMTDIIASINNANYKYNKLAIRPAWVKLFSCNEPCSASGYFYGCPVKYRIQYLEKHLEWRKLMKKKDKKYFENDDDYFHR